MILVGGTWGLHESSRVVVAQMNANSITYIMCLHLILGASNLRKLPPNFGTKLADQLPNIPKEAEGSDFQVYVITARRPPQVLVLVAHIYAPWP